MQLRIEYERENPRRDPEVLGQQLSFAWHDRVQGGDGASVCSTFPSHLTTLQAAAREFIDVSVVYSGYADPTMDVLKLEWLNLFTLMFHCYFQYMRVGVFQDTSPDPLIDALLLLCDCSDLQTLSQTSGYQTMLLSLQRCIAESLSSSNSSDDDVVLLLAQLKAVWVKEKYLRLNAMTVSLMPWSTASIKEGSLFAPAPVYSQARIHPWIISLAERCEKLLTFPDMLWLGASHDGHPRYSSITSYVSARWSPSFTPYDNAALWQAALTFGVLEAITGVVIPEAFLLNKRSDGTRVFTCHNISVLVLHWFIHVFHNENEDVVRKGHSLETILRASRALALECEANGWDIFASLVHLPQNNVDDIICAMTLLLSAFDYPVFRSCMHNFTGSLYVSSNGQQRAIEIFLGKIVAGGWCPSLRYSDRLGNPQYWWYASSFKPFIRHDRREHINCSEKSCIIHSIDEATYVTRHTTNECSCPFLLPSIESVGRILRSGGIPAISYTDGALAVHSASNELPYIAISHVWVDGLGSSTEKGLPRCQIERISRYVHELLGLTVIPAFWIGGLCIPESRELRNKAIVMMRKTYEQAAKVLVFDSSIRTLCSSVNSVEENVFRISTSTWMQRVWTLQEALLAKELYFEFSTGIASAAKLFERLDQRAAMDHGVGWMTTAFAVGGSTPTRCVLEPSITGSKPTFREIMDLLFRRSTSKPKDEPLAIAGLLNVDPEKIIAQPDLESRIRTLFIEVGTLPRDWIFGEYERMKTPGFRWCPTALTSVGQMLPQSADAVCTLDGLTTKTDTLVLCLPRIDVLKDMDTDVYVNVTSIGAFYNLQLLLESISKDSPCSINALLVRRDELSSLSIGTSTPVVAVNIPKVEDTQSVQITDYSPLVCKYVMRTMILAYGEAWDPAMEGHPMLEGRLVRARVMVT